MFNYTFLYRLCNVVYALRFCNIDEIRRSSTERILDETARNLNALLFKRNLKFKITNETQFNIIYKYIIYKIAVRSTSPNADSNQFSILYNRIISL